MTATEKKALEDLRKLREKLEAERLKKLREKAGRLTRGLPY